MANDAATMLQRRVVTLNQATPFVLPEFPNLPSSLLNNPEFQEYDRRIRVWSQQVNAVLQRHLSRDENT